jgi:RNA polymerase sigma-70 factor, ECF subfamily
MSHIEDMKYEEISEVLRIQVGTVKSRMHNAVKRLRAILKEDEL